MESENPNIDEITEQRRQAIKESIRPMTTEELNALGETLFPSIIHPWRAAYFTFITDNAGGDFYHATTGDDVHIVYCRAKEKGLWFLPTSGAGPLQAKGLAMLKEIVSAN